MRNNTVSEIMPADVANIRIKRSSKKSARIRSYIDQAGDPYRLSYGKAIIEIDYLETTATLQDRLRECLICEKI